MILVSSIAIVVGFAAGIAGGLLSRLVQAGDRVPANNGARAIRATNIALVDEQGRERTVLKLVEGRPVLVLTDEQRLASGDVVSMPRVAVGILHDGTPSLELGDPGGRTRVSLAVTASGAAVLEMTAKHGKARATVNVGADGPAELTFVDQLGNYTLKLP